MDRPKSTDVLVQAQGGQVGIGRMVGLTTADCMNGDRQCRESTR